MGKLSVAKGALAKARAKLAEQGDFSDLKDSATPGRYDGFMIGGRCHIGEKGLQAIFDFKIPEIDPDAKGGIFYNTDDQGLPHLLRLIKKLMGSEVVDQLDESKLEKNLDEIFAHLESEKPCVRISVVEAETKKGDTVINFRIDKTLPEMSYTELQGATSAKTQPQEGEQQEIEEVVSKPATDGKPAKAAVAAGTTKAGKAAAPEVEEQEEQDAPEDELTKLGRVALKQKIRELKIDVQILKTMTDDDLRKIIRDAPAPAAASEEEEEQEAPTAKEPDGVDIVAGMKLKAMLQGKEQMVEILEVFEAEGKVRIVSADGKWKGKIPGTALRP